jgi:hypothetical protein
LIQRIGGAVRNLGRRVGGQAEFHPSQYKDGQHGRADPRSASHVGLSLLDSPTPD